MEEKLTVIEPKNGWFDIHLRDVWHYRDLILLFVRRNFVARYKQTVLGPVWALLQPLMTTAIFTVIFGNLAGLSAAGVPKFLFYLSGTVMWGYFSACLTQTSHTFTGNAMIFGKVYFPRVVMPIATVLTNLISFGIQFLMFLGFWAYYWYQGAVRPNAGVLLLPVLLVHMALLSLGVGIIVSALTTKYRDLNMLVSFGVQLWMYATPVAYDIAIIPEKYMALYLLNPMTPVIQCFRRAFLGIGTVSAPHYLASWGFTLVILLVGLMLFSRVEKTFMDTV